MSIFKAYDIRGIYGENLTEKDAYKIGFYLGKYLKLTEIKIGHDTRLSSESLTKYLVKGLLDANCNVIYLGLISTPNFYYSLFSGTENGVMVTASHNSKEYNGFKIMSNGNSFDSRNGLYNIEKLVNEDLFELSESFESIHLEKISLSDFLVKNNILSLNTKEDYIQYLLDLYLEIFSDEEKKAISDLIFSIDFSSGMSSIAITEFFKKINLEVKYYNEVLDGDFPNHSPDPVKAEDYLKQIENDSMFSFVFDGDGDRIVLYNEKNDLVLPDYMIALLINYFSKDEKNFVCDLRASKFLSEIALDKNLNLKLMRVGRAFYSDYMKENDCIFGAELSGHMFFRKFNFLDNPDVALIYLLKIITLEYLKDENFRFSNFISKYMKYYKKKEINLEVVNSDNVLDSIKENFKENLILELDGLSFNFDSYWFNIRKSNTEPVLKINIEGISKKIVDLEFEKLKNLIMSI